MMQAPVTEVQRPSLRGGIVACPVRRDERGALVLYDGEGLPFTVVRSFVVFDVPPGAMRGDHAHRWTEELLVVVAGRARVQLERGDGRVEVALDRPDRGLHVPPLTWVRYWLEPGSVLLVHCSHPYDPEDTLSDRAAWERLSLERS